MKRARRMIAVVLLTVAGSMPLGGCVGGPAQGLGQLMGLALGVGASVGSYYLIKELN